MISIPSIVITEGQIEDVLFEAAFFAACVQFAGSLLLLAEVIGNAM